MPANTPSRRPRLAQISLSIVVPVVATLLFLALAHSGSPAQARPTEDVTVKIDDQGFSPAVITVTVGTIVVWENDSDDHTHTVAFDGGPTSPILQPGDDYRRTFDIAGSYAYQCSLHPTQTGMVHVIDGPPPLEAAELSVTSRHDQPITPGAAIDYHILYENHSDVSAQNTVLTVTLPSGATLLSSSRGGVPLPPTSQAGQALVYVLGVVLPDSERQLDLQVRMPDPLPSGEIMLFARISADNQDPEDADNSTEDSGQAAIPRLTVGVRPRGGSVFMAGRVVTYTLEYANRSDEVAAPAVTITLQLPTVITFIGASHDDDSGQAPVPSSANGNEVSLFLGDLAPEASGRLHAQMRLADGLAAGQALSITARIAAAIPTTTGGPEDDDSVSSDSQVTPADAPHMYVRLTSTGDNEVGGTRLYQVHFGNRGTQEVTQVRVTLTLPDGVDDVDFGVTPPTSFAQNSAVWHIESLDDDTSARPLNVRATIRESGPLTATATITGTSDAPQAEPAETEAVEVEPVIPLTRPMIYAPRGATVGPRPLFRGLGTPGATVSLFLAATPTSRALRLGTAVVGVDRAWTISPTLPISITGWHWVTATQALDIRVSGTAGTSFVVNPAPPIDPDSFTRDQMPLGGLNPTLGWAPNRHYNLGLTILTCPVPISPTLQASFYNAAGLMTGYQYYPGVASATDARQVSFDYLTPARTVPFELYVNYDCPSSSAPGGVTHHRDCLEGPSCCDDPPSPPPGCEDCVPGKPPRPQPIDPDGFVYDAAAVRAGATITQSIITRAWVTATRQIAPGAFTPWNALEYSQVNPQYTDSLYPDKVLAPGYYSFRVPPGAYRMSVIAPGFVPFESPVLTVLNEPVTFHVPLERSAGILRDVPTLPPNRLFLPLVSRGP